MDRRAFVAGGVAAWLGAAAGASGPRNREGPTVPWSHEGFTGPRRWAELAPEYAACAAPGQSPVDLEGLAPAAAEPVLNWAASDWDVVHAGHTIEAGGARNGHLVLGGVPHALLSVAFRTPSEHAIGGRRFAMEAQFLHRHAGGGLAMVAVFLEPGRANGLFHEIVTLAPPGPGRLPMGRADPRALLPGSRAALRYRGSLTVPPCTAPVEWLVLLEPVPVAEADIAAFRARFPMNARPLQPRPAGT